MLIPMLTLIYLFDPEVILQSDKFNENDKILIRKCCNLLKYLYNLETGEEITKENEVFSICLYKEYKDQITGKQIDDSREYYESRLKSYELEVIEKLEYDDVKDVNELLSFRNENQNSNCAECKVDWIYGGNEFFQGLNKVKQD